MWKRESKSELIRCVLSLSFSISFVPGDCFESVCMRWWYDERREKDMLLKQATSERSVDSNEGEGDEEKRGTKDG